MNNKRLSPNIPKVDIVEPFYIGNFFHKRSLLCNSLLHEAKEILSHLGWEDNFSMYHHIGDTNNVRIYFRIAYISIVYIDGSWDDIKTRLPALVPLIKSYKELRQHADIVSAKWVEPNAKNIDWIQEDYAKYIMLKGGN